MPGHRIFKVLRHIPDIKPQSVGDLCKFQEFGKVLVVCFCQSPIQIVLSPLWIQLYFKISTSLKYFYSFVEIVNYNGQCSRRVRSAREVTILCSNYRKLWKAAKHGNPLANKEHRTERTKEQILIVYFSILDSNGPPEAMGMKDQIGTGSAKWYTFANHQNNKIAWEHFWLSKII